MPFAPHEIENKKFVVAMRGYQTDEVEGFLRAVAADYRALLQELKDADHTSPNRLVADIERVMGSARAEAEREAAELRAAAAAEAAAIRDAAEREAAELREATQREAEACFDEIARQADELRRLEAALWHRMHALEHTVVEARQTLSHVAEIYPVPRDPVPSVDAPLYRIDRTTAEETNVEAAIAAR
jgi:DivIVA domain-containing protein